MSTATWTNNGTSLEKEFVFPNFKVALAFVVKVGNIAESLNHHPDIFLHSYKKVKLSITTHERGALTKLDYKLSEQIDLLVGPIGTFA